ncbi:ribonuclease H-like domain-containing protein [Diplogelasinospora grovesii]|uniref:Ribonuclease H-like domain-containing protein n=1 Tax=Diplogelasinospora grovesii TaxID=303347 RepID=A0AAN6S7Z3_9PEZI|nr:ribonuclease H-like domain-containing protein [Diplogelasinospora grovesii]
MIGTLNKQLELLLIILPDAITLLYNRIKHYGDVKYSIYTIYNYFVNKALKFNLKLGGNNQLLNSSRRGLIDEDKTMVISIDIMHPLPGSAPNAPNITSMVASFKAHKEMASDLSDMLKSRLRLWKDPRHDKHANLPKNILVYRDGTVLDEEDMYLLADQKKGLPRLTVVIGMARPAHYFVLLDEIFHARYNVANVLEALTQSMCYTYGRATKAVSVCTPAYYADVVYEWARCYLSGAIGAEPAAVRSEDVLVYARLRDSMFYI